MMQSVILSSWFLRKRKITGKYIWFPDTGCTNYRTGSKEPFIDLDELVWTVARLVDDNMVLAIGNM